MTREACYQANLSIPVEKAWEIMQDLTVPHRYVPGVYKCVMHTTEQKGIGTSRRVYKKMYGFLKVELDETVVEWNEGSGFTLRLHDGDKDRGPMPKSYFEYKVESSPGGRTLLTGAMGYTFPGGAFGALIDAPFVFPPVKAEIKGVVAAIKYFYESGGQSPSKEDLKREKGFVHYVKRPASMHKR